MPVRDAPEVVGHVVRQLYLDCGAVDVAVELGDRELLDGVVRRWRDMVATRSYVTGALGSRHKDEAFGDPYELPPDRAYAETCAAIASAMLAWRLLLATGDPDCADVLERTVYNAILPAISADGTSFFYVNPLQRRSHRAWAEPGDGQRKAWYACACCPPNLMRLISGWQQVIATTDDAGVQIHQYAAAGIEAGDIRLTIETDYPWDGKIAVRILATPARPWTLSLRVPGWCQVATIRAPQGEAEAVERGARSAHLTRSWQAGDVIVLELEMEPRITEPDPRVDAVRGCVAIERGPLVYALETADLPPGLELEDVTLSADASPIAVPRPDIAPSVVGVRLGAATSAGATEADAIPYFAWGNRGDGGMRVWVPRVGP